MPSLAFPLRLAGASVLAASALFVSTPERAEACAFVGARRDQLPATQAEQALIVWDAEHRTEHFIRQARIGRSRRAFGFLVPTPSRPELGAVPRNLFAELGAIYTAPQSRSATSMGGGVRSAGAPPAVRVVEQRRVAGLSATVLQASDAAALTAYLGRHGFVARPALTDWLRPYVERGGYVTAFRYVPRDGRPVPTAPVRLSFQTDVPVYPYAEPSDAAITDGRRLVVSVVASGRVAGFLGETPWGAPVGYAGTPSTLPSILRDALPPGVTIPTTMTTFDDATTRRGGVDLTFRVTGGPAVSRSVRP